MASKTGSGIGARRGVGEPRTLAVGATASSSRGAVGATASSSRGAITSTGAKASRD